MADLVDAYLYGRVSTKKQLAGMGIQLQNDDLQACLAEHPEWRLTGTFRDLGISAYRGANKLKGELGSFIKLVSDGEVTPGSVLMVYSLDRVSRDNVLQAQGILLDLLRAGVLVCTTINRMVISPYDDDKTMADKLSIALNVFIRANEEAATRSDRGKKAWRLKRIAASDHKTGMSANVPAWLDTDNRNAIQNPVKSKTVSRMFELCAAGHGYAGILQRLEAEGLESFGRSKRWSPAYIRQILTDRSVIGEKQLYFCNYDTEKKPVPTGEPIRDYYPQIIPYDLWERAQHQMAIRSSASPGMKTRATAPVNLFARLCRCVDCGGTMEIVCHRNKRNHYLRCHNRYVRKSCPTGGNYAYEQFEEITLTVLRRILCDDLSSPDSNVKKLDEQISKLITDLKSAETRHGRLYDLYANGDDDPALLNRLADGKSLIAGLKSQISDAERTRSISMMRPETLASDVAVALIQRARDHDPDARVQVAAEIRSIVSLVGFRPDGLIIVEIGNGTRFAGVRKGQLLWILGVNTETGVAEYPLIIDDPAWTDDLVYAAVRRLEGLSPKAQPNVGATVTRIERERERIIDA